MGDQIYKERLHMIDSDYMKPAVVVVGESKVCHCKLLGEFPNVSAANQFIASMIKQDNKTDSDNCYQVVNKTDYQLMLNHRW